MSRQRTIAGLSEAKQALLCRRLQLRDSMDVIEEAISADASEGPTPLSATQRRLWLALQLEPGVVIYNVTHAMRICGGLSIPDLKRALDKVVERHEALRTTVSLLGEEPQLVVTKSLSLELPLVDLSHLPAENKEAQAQNLARKEVYFDFDLSAGPLIRVLLLRFGEREHLLVVTMHHIISDGWSRGVLSKELQHYYSAFLNARLDELPQAAISYRDFVLWQRRWLAGEEVESLRRYWRKYLADVAVLNLPADRQRADIPRHLGAHRQLRLSRQLTNALRALAAQHNATLFMLMLAALQLLFHRLSGQEDILVGVPIAGRNRHPELDEVIGFFVNTLALRADLSTRPTFIQLLEQVRDSALGAYSHSNLPYDEVVADLKPERRAGRDPFIDVLFNFGDSSWKQCHVLEGTTTEHWSIAEPVANYPLTLYGTPDERGLSLSLLYQRQLFSDERGEELLCQYSLLLEQIVAEPGISPYCYSLVTSAAALCLPDPSPPLDEPDFPPICREFYTWVEQTPQATALRQGGCRWTYSQLAERTQILAEAMASHGLSRGDVVAVSGRRSPDLIAAINAVLAMGAVLLTVDPDLPAMRRRLMLEQSGARGILLGPGGRRPEAMDDIVVLVLDQMERPAGGNSSQASLLPDPEVIGDDPAYIFYTSGSTGVPKTVLGCHKGLSHFLAWQRDSFAVGPDDRVAQLTGLSFDVLLRDIFLPLSCGATVCLPEENDETDLLTYLERERVTILHTVPSRAQSWLSTCPPGLPLMALRWVFFGGEPLTDTLLHRWREAFHGGGELVNLYGATETTLVKCYYRPGAELEPGVQPAGRPLPQTQALVLNRNRRLCGIGETGEIVLRTPFRSLGYYNSGQKEQQQFVKNPFREDANDILYFTGDRGRYRHDGVLEVAGRLDDQVKIRGVRVEPAEVTAALCRHQSVQAGIVVGGGEDAAEDKMLVAYVVPVRAVEVPQLRAYMAERLPAAMVPGAWVIMEKLPLLTNGKVDRSALPEPEQLPTAAAGCLAPRNITERVLVRIWGELLGMDEVGVEDDFFALGGHSLLATQAVSRTNQQLRASLTLRQFFQQPTIATQAELLKYIQASENDAGPLAIKALSRDVYRR